MTAINSGLHEVPGVRLPLQTSYASPSPHTVFMYSTGGEGSVTLQLRDTDDLDDKSGFASVLARLQQEDATLSISLQDTEMLTEGSIDVLLGTGSLHTTGNGGTTATYDLFDSESGQDLTLSPQTFTSSTEAFINDNSDSLGVPGDTDTVGSTEDAKVAADSSKLAVKKPRPKASSPNRQGPQQCQTCGKVFGNASALAKHKLTHSDERKYVCSMCGKAFKRQDHLNGHMLTHRNKKPYECKAEGCGKSYCDARSLRRHTENHHTNTSASASAACSNNTSSTAASTTASNVPAAAAAVATSSGSAATTSSSTAAGSTAAGAVDESSSTASCIQYAPPPAQQPAVPPPPPYPASSSPASTSTAASKTAPSQLQQLLASEPASPSSTAPNKTPNNAQSVNNDGLTKQQLDLIHQIMQQTQQQAAAHQTASANSKATSGGGSKTVTSGAKSRTWTVQNSNVGGTTNNKASQQAGAATGGSTVTTPGGVKPQDPKPVECNLCHRKFKNIPALNGHMRLHGGYFKKDSELKKAEKKDISGPPLQTASMSVRALIEEKIIQKRITNPQLATTTHLAYAASDSTTPRVQAPPQYIKTEPDLGPKLSSFVVPAPPQSLSVGEKLRRHSDSEHFVSPRAPAEEAAVLAELLLKRGGGGTAKKVAGVKRASSDPGHQGSASPQLQLSFQGDGSYLTYQAEDGGYFSPSLQDDVFQQVSVQDTMLLHGVDPSQLADTIQMWMAGDRGSLVQFQADMAALEDYSHSPGPYPAPHTTQQQDFQLPVSLADFAPYQTAPQQQYVHSPAPSSQDSPGFTYPTPPASQEGQFEPQQPFGQSVISHVPPASSPLSAAFYTGSMSSAAAVEAALSEVLPSESMYRPSPPPRSPLSNPIPLQSQMMPNSEDPLLSSSPKDFCSSRKRFDFGGIHSLRLMDLGVGNPGLAGIVVDNNGELKFFQAAPPVMGTAVARSGAPPHQRLPRLGLDAVKEEGDDDVFLSPTSIPASPIRVARKRPRTDPLSMPPHSHPTFQSRLRAPRLSEGVGPPQPYTPPPMLSPARAGQGLFWQAAVSSSTQTTQSAWPSSTTLSSGGEMSEETVGDGAPECDAAPHINVGPDFQCVLPQWSPDRDKANREPSYEHLLWDPGINKVCSRTEIDMYLEFACCAAVPGGGRNKEYALHLLHMCHGSIHEAMLKLMQPTPLLPAGHPLLSYEYLESDRWSAEEMDAFHQALVRHDKDFRSIAREIGSKTVKQCIQFYYFWKKVCPEEYRRLRLIRRRQNPDSVDVDEGRTEDSSRHSLPVNDVELVSTSSESRLFVCEYPDCSASFNSRAALNGHIRIHGGGVCGRSPTPDKRPATATPPTLGDILEEFPCKICGKVFNKVKSRSAHMKSHRPPDAEPKKPKIDPHKMDAHKMEVAEQNLARGMGVTSSNIGIGGNRHN